MITLAITITWTSVYLDKDLSEKTCYVKENSDGTFMIMQDVDESQLSAENIHNVGNRFQYLSMSYLAQGVLSFICCALQLIAIFCFSSLLPYTYLVSRVNKLVLLYGLYILILTHIYRFDEAGKLCSGDDLTDA